MCFTPYQLEHYGDMSLPSMSVATDVQFSTSASRLAARVNLSFVITLRALIYVIEVLVNSLADSGVALPHSRKE